MRSRRLLWSGVGVVGTVGAAQGKDVRIGGGAATIRQYLQAGLLDEIHLAISPILLGQGESLFEGIDLPALGYRVKEHVSSGAAMHLVVGRKRIAGVALPR
jgi:dihydrofolate reductase